MSDAVPVRTSRHAPDTPATPATSTRPDEPVTPERPTESPTRRNVKRTIKLVAFLFVFIYFGLPAIGGVRRAIDELSEVRPGFLIIGLGLQFTSWICYSQMTRAALPPHAIPLLRLWRIQMATKALTNVVPAGSAAGSALGYRLLTLSGVRGSDAGFALATAGLGSAVVLNFIVWIALVLSIPFRGVNPLYGTAAIIGVIVLGIFAFLVFSLMKGRSQSERAVRSIARRLRMDEEKAGQTVRHIAARLRELMTEPRLLARVTLWASANWLLDAASLWVFLRAFGASAPIDGLLVSFGIANLVAAIPITPGGLGLVEGVYVPLLTGFGVPRAVVGLAVPTYRLAQFWLPIPVGAICYFTLRVGPASLDRTRRLDNLRKVAVEAAVTAEGRLDWAERYGHRTLDPTAPLDRPAGRGSGEGSREGGG
jgi:putative heme transporter